MALCEHGLGLDDLQRSLQLFYGSVFLVGKDVQRGKNTNPLSLKSVAEEERSLGAKEGKMCEEPEQSMQGVAKQVKIGMSKGWCFLF